VEGAGAAREGLVDDVVAEGRLRFDHDAAAAASVKPRQGRSFREHDEVWVVRVISEKGEGCDEKREGQRGCGVVGKCLE
jgi:hypothetical protein